MRVNSDSVRERATSECGLKCPVHESVSAHSLRCTQTANNQTRFQAFNPIAHPPPARQSLVLCFSTMPNGLPSPGYLISGLFFGAFTFLCFRDLTRIFVAAEQNYAEEDTDDNDYAIPAEPVPSGHVEEGFNPDKNQIGLAQTPTDGSMADDEASPTTAEKRQAIERESRKRLGDRRDDVAAWVAVVRRTNEEVEKEERLKMLGDGMGRKVQEALLEGDDRRAGEGRKRVGVQL
ncbi:hypothetical protein PMIN03_003679 [Paraphaeosphaeria minitans]